MGQWEVLWTWTPHCTHRRYEQPKVNEWSTSALANTTKSLTMKCPPSRTRQRGHRFHLYIRVPGTRYLAFSLSKSNANVQATINWGPKCSLYVKSGGFELYLRPSQTNLTHSRTILKPSAASGILVRSRFACDPSLCSGGCKAEYKMPSQ